jgi:hypothetical protein
VVPLRIVNSHGRQGDLSTIAWAPIARVDCAGSELPTKRGALLDALIEFEQSKKFLFGQVFKPSLIGPDDFVGQRLFDLLSFKNSFLNRTLGHKFVNRNGLGLPNAVGTVLSLVVVGRIPIVIVEDDRVGPSEVQPRATRLRADQKAMDSRVPIELVDKPLPALLGSVSVKANVADLPLLEEDLNDVQHLSALRKQQRPVLAVDDFLD